MSHQGPKRERQRRQWRRREGSLFDFLSWRARESYFGLMIGWFFFPPACILGAVISAVRGNGIDALQFLVMGAVTLSWLFFPVLTFRFVIRRTRTDV